MHSPVISKIRCFSSNQKNTKAWIHNHLIYIGTRKGVDLSSEFLNGDSKKEEETFESVRNNDYLKYIADRPRSHGLFGNIDVTDIKALGKTLSDKSANNVDVFRAVLSLSEKDAVELGYTTKEKWSLLLNSRMKDIGHEFGIPVDRLEWVAAFHMEPTHPHCHYMFWDSNQKIKSSFIHESRQHKCREHFAKEILKDERPRLAKEKTNSRDKLVNLGKNVLQTESISLRSLIPKPISEKQVSIISVKIIELMDKLPPTGRLKYKLLEPEVKQEVHKVVDELLKIPSLKKEFTHFLKLNEQLSNSYSPSKARRIWNMENAKNEIYKRLGNQILNCCKQISNSNIPIQNNNSFLYASSFQLILSCFRDLAMQNNRQNLWCDPALQSQSKENRKIQARKQKEHYHSDNLEK